MIQNICRSKEAPFLSTLAIIGGKWIIRTEYPQLPPKVEYTLSDKGKTFIPIINTMCDWGREHAAKR